MNGIFWGADDNYVQATGYKQEQKIRFIENIVNVLANQGKLDDILIDEWPYISEKYLQILQPYLEREVLTNGDGVIGLLQNLLEGEISYSESFFEKTKCLYQKATNTSHTSAEVQTSPLVLDLDGDGVETVSVDQGTYFDHDGNGFAENTGWVGTDDGLLVRDLNENGVIDDGTELFGNNSVLSSGATAENGFEALADLDSNEDGVFDSSDTAWNSVKVWKDNNYNAQVDTGELLTLEQAGISGINLNYNYQDATDEQNNAHTQKALREISKPYFLMVAGAGFEPATFRL